MQKKVLSLLLALICTLGFSFGFTACDNGAEKQKHTHTFETGWTRDDTSHWHKATCGHTGERSEEAAHSYNGGLKKDETSHWLECSVCGERGNLVAHSYNSGWKKDETLHWLECAFCGERGSLAAHAYGDDDLCDICNYRKPGEELPEPESPELCFTAVWGEHSVIGCSVGAGDAKYEEKIVIPASYDGLPVLSVGSDEHVEFVHRMEHELAGEYPQAMGEARLSIMQTFTFAYCIKLKEVVLSDGIPAIGDEAFFCCFELTSITIPNSVTSIGSTVFNGCSKLTSIDFNGTIDEWKAIEKGYAWRYGTKIQEVKCTNGTLSGNDIG